ncbi:MAG: zinc ribbon domain-containing protein, partial [Chloroflexi bacterium]|nr:zinc ribbon domain-containing protein [Chloroflexota bacterium]
VACANCGAQNNSSQNFCSQCGAPLVKKAPPQPAWEAPAPPQASMTEPLPRALPQRFQFLGIATPVFRIIGWVVLIGGSLCSIGIFMLMSQGALDGLSGLLNRLMEILGLGAVTSLAKIAMMLAGIIASLLSGLSMLAFAELCEAIKRVEARSQPRE